MTSCPDAPVLQILIALGLVVCLLVVALAYRAMRHLPWDRATVYSILVILCLFVLLVAVCRWTGFNPFPSNPCKGGS